MHRTEFASRISNMNLTENCIECSKTLVVAGSFVRVNMIPCIYRKRFHSFRPCIQQALLLYSQDHLNRCPKQLLYCEKKCGEQLQRHLLPNHEMNECPKRVLPCPYNCGRDFGYDTLPGHLPNCPKYPLLCPNSCSMTNLSRNDLPAHLTEGCASSVLSCPLKELGCHFKVLSQLKANSYLVANKPVFCR